MTQKYATECTSSAKVLSYLELDCPSSWVGYQLAECVALWGEPEQVSLITGLEYEMEQSLYTTNYLLSL